MRTFSLFSAVVLLCICGLAQSPSPQLPVSKDQLQCMNNPTAPGCQDISSPDNLERSVAAPVRVPQIKGSLDDDQPQNAVTTPNPPAPEANKPATPETEFEQLVADSVGRPLPTYGQFLFSRRPANFAPLTRVEVPSDYVIGPGDELQIRVWGSVEADLRVTVDRAGQIYIPHVGSVSVAGIHFADLPNVLRTEISRVYRKFELTVNVGRIRSMQVFVMGQVRNPGNYTISSLSTLVNALFAAGGPTKAGSFRHVELRRDGKVESVLDLYDLLLKGDKTKDIKLQSGDVVFVPAVGPLAAISGSVNVPAIYELLPSTTLNDLLANAGGLSAVADVGKVVVERIDKTKSRSVLEFTLDSDSGKMALKDGDIVKVLSIVPSIADAVTLRGNVANAGNFPWKEGMRIHDLIPDPRVLLTREYWLRRAAITSGRNTEYPVKQEPVAGAEKKAIEDKPPISSDVLVDDLHRYSPAINWHYATIQRVNPVTLETSLLAFDLEQAILTQDSSQNLELKPGDIVTIFSQNDISVPVTDRDQYITLEGEVVHPGVYKIGSADTLRSVVSRAGGLTPNAYMYGTALTRESARQDQQRSLDELANSIETQVKLLGMAAANRPDSPELAGTASAQQTLVSSLRKAQATGRVVLALGPNMDSADAYPAIALEDHDRILVPRRPNTVSVVGMVYNSASFIYSPKRKVGDYLKMAGKGKPNADTKHMFILHPDGSVVARSSVNSAFSGDEFNKIRLHPGDQIVVPYKINTGNLTRGLREWSQIASQLALGAASIAVIAK